MLNEKSLDVKTLSRYLGPPMVHPIEYWAKMWRVPDANGKKFVIKCPKEDNCIIYYTDREGIEHRDSMKTINQLPPEYRQEKVGEDIAKTINSNTPLTFQTVASLFGDPYIDPDVPFVYIWKRGDYVLTMVGKIFSYSKTGEDDRSTLTLFGQLPPDFRFALNTQVNKESMKQIPLDSVDPKKVLKETEASKAAKTLENSPKDGAEYAEDPNRIKTVADLSYDDLTDTLKDLGVTTTKSFDEEFTDDDDTFVADPSKIKEAKATSITPRKKMALKIEDLDLPEFTEPNPVPDKHERDMNEEELTIIRAWRARKGNVTRQRNKIIKEAGLKP